METTPPAPAVNLPVRASKPLIYWVIILVLLLYSVIVTVILVFKRPSLNVANTVTAPDSGKLFTSQTAIIKGKVTEAEESRIKIVSSTGETGVVELSDNVAINDGRVLIGSESAQLKKIPLNKEASIIMNVIDGGYKVVAINLDNPITPPAGAAMPTVASSEATFVPPPSSLPGPIVIP